VEQQYETLWDMQATSAALEGGLKWRKKNRQIFDTERYAALRQLGIT
jgi:hypothetical protein